MATTTRDRVSGEFARDTEPFRRELITHCYRMLGLLHDAEDVVQETYLRAWRSYGQFEQRSSVRTWLHRIATNARLTALQHRGRRVLPSELAGPSDDPHTVPVAEPNVAWLEPIPGPEGHRFGTGEHATGVDRHSATSASPAACDPAAARRVGIPGCRGRRDAGNHRRGRQERAATRRATIKNAAPVPDEITEPSAPRAREVLEQYIAAFENADAALLERILRHDAALEMIGSRTWFAGRATCMPYIATHVLGAPGDWRMLPIIANGQPAAVAYHRGEPFGIAVLTVTRSGISRIVVFDDAGSVAKFSP
jgi:RNA polymerase sigma-70 factor, ECF subfamily